jgi:predicted ATP-dependent endonuclease of OLD family
VRNFRNLADVDLPLLPGAVIVGENQSGKCNLLHALRLILDANMSFNDRAEFEARNMVDLIQGVVVPETHGAAA